MGVSNSQKYTITKHAAKRIHTRFNISSTQIRGWVSNFLSEATFFQYSDEESDKSVQIFKKGDVLVVLNVENFTIITAYPYNPFNKTNGLSKDTVDKLQPSLDKIVAEEKIRLRNDLDGMMIDLQLSFQAFQNHPKSEVLLKKYIRSLKKINSRIETSKALIGDIEGLKE
ncbi:DUF4258 domain-containing protein [Companilactobacillus halodurans]|uniref:DUF4258 domain-containing protein n=1 Tax=Companilactobacillus halodurans TaxID=2584183 RepID=A0A5P0ZQT6_9LACO|nr:DUF4258 domain-containing protein [Companilactobacillus halodurans]MQS76241.1 DUF4258 domain-containing protein [Companilactobacillus halodurans]MQS97382.1 DUF4258 domain-containing protein [Companilactobacillus halodurans]